MATTPVAGWYPDPSNAQQLRYWDGARWTDRTTSRPASAPQQQRQQPAAGWYPDRSNAAQLRYWDGARWTEQTQPRPTATAAAETPAQAYAAQQAGVQGRQQVEQRAQARRDALHARQMKSDVADRLAVLRAQRSPQPVAAPAQKPTDDEDALARTLMITGGVAAGIGFLGALTAELHSRTAERNARLAAEFEEDDWDDVELEEESA